MVGRIHRTVEGQTWDVISKIYYGNEKYVHELLKANSRYRNYAVLPAGLEIVIPEIEIQTVQELPPWKR